MRLILMIATWAESPIHVPMNDSFQTTAQLLCELSATYTGSLAGIHESVVGSVVIVTLSQGSVGRCLRV